MATVSAKVVRVNVRAFDERNEDAKIRYRVEFDTTFTGITKVDGEYVEAEINYIDFVPRFLIANCLQQVNGLEYMYNKKKERGARAGRGNDFGAAELGVILRDALFHMTREKQLAGSEYADSDGVVCVREHDRYETVIDSIEVTDKIQDKLDKLIDENVFM